MHEYLSAQGSGFISDSRPKNADGSKYTIVFSGLSREQMAHVLASLADFGYPVKVTRDIERVVAAPAPGIGRAVMRD